MIKFYLYCASGNMSKYIYDLGKQNFCIDILVDDYGNLQHFINIDTLDDVLKIKKVTKQQLIIADFEDWRVNQLQVKYPNYNFPQHEMELYDDYIE